MKKLFLMLFLVALASLAFAQADNQAPAWMTFTRTGPTTGLIQWSVEPSLNVDYYYFAVHPVSTEYYPPAYCDPNWNLPGGWAGSQLQDPVGTYNKVVTGLIAGTDYHAYIAAVNTNAGWSWTALSSWDSPPPPLPYDCPETIAVDLYPDVTLTMLVGNANYAAGQPPTPPFNPSFTTEHTKFFTLVGAGPWTMRFDTTLGWVWVVGYGVYAGPGVIDVLIPASKDMDIEVQFGNGGDPTLPVELSSYYATLTAGNTVSIQWVTQSETDLRGFRVYRNLSSNSESSQLITPAMIPATNTSNASSYAHEDREVEPGSTYYYWLESIENWGESSFYGPVSITVVEEVTSPELLISRLDAIYPNPFDQGHHINLNASVKNGENGTIRIYNLRGEIVKTYTLNSGIHALTWDGKDTNGLLCGSGVYFFRLSTPSISQVKKILMLK